MPRIINLWGRRDQHEAKSIVDGAIEHDTIITAFGRDGKNHTYRPRLHKMHGLSLDRLRTLLRNAFFVIVTERESTRAEKK